MKTATTVSEILAALAPLGVSVVVSGGTVVVTTTCPANDVSVPPPARGAECRFCDSLSCEECQERAWSGDWRARLGMLPAPKLATVIALPVRGSRTKRAA